MTHVIDGRDESVFAGGSVLVTVMRPDDLSGLEAMLRRCSPATLFHRFHGYSDGIAYVRGQLDLGRDLARVARTGECCVGFGVLAADTDGMWHLGVLVEDGAQRRGLGGRLVVALAADARRRGITRLRAQVLSEDVSMATALRRLGPLRCQIDGPDVTVDVDLVPPSRWAQ